MANGYYDIMILNIMILNYFLINENIVTWEGKESVSNYTAGKLVNWDFHIPMSMPLS